jgi:maleate cis-trans isomerase
VQALRSFGAQRVALITPYAPDTNALEVAYLAGHGFDVVENVALDLAGSTDYPRLDPEDWRQAVRDADTSQADAIFVSCTNIRITDAIDHIEQDLGKPVVTSNQAGLWYSLRRIGFPTGVSGYGSLLRDHLQLPTQP